MKTIIAGLVLVVAISTPAISQDTFKYEEKINALVKPFLENQKIQCASVGVFLKGKAWTFNFGQLSDQDPSKPDGDTIYEIGSISKVFTSVLLADAVNQGRVKLEQPLGELMEGLAADNPDVAKKITLQHLAQHMSGLPRMPSNLRPSNPNNPFVDYDRKRLTEFMKQVRPDRDPGEKSEYSNLAAGLLGDLLAAESNLDYQTLLTRQVLKPLGMNDTTLELGKDQQSRLAPPHNSSLLPDHNWDFDALAGAGGIRSSVNDMLLFIDSNLNRPENETGKALALAWKEQLAAGDGHLAMGLGWMIAGDGSTRWHNGQTGGYHSMILVSRKLDAGVVLLCNSAGSEIDGLAESIFQTIVGMNVEPKKFAKAVHVDESVLKRLVGKYQLAPQVVISITANGKKMMVQLTGQQALGITPESDTIWNLNDVKAQLRFELPKSGPASKVTLHQNGMVMPSPRIQK